MLPGNRKKMATIILRGEASKQPYVQKPGEESSTGPTNIQGQDDGSTLQMGLRGAMQGVSSAIAEGDHERAAKHLKSFVKMVMHGGDEPAGDDDHNPGYHG